MGKNQNLLNLKDTARACLPAGALAACKAGIAEAENNGKPIDWDNKHEHL